MRWISDMTDNLMCEVGSCAYNNARCSVNGTTVCLEHSNDGYDNGNDDDDDDDNLFFQKV
jgi:hypothetical protein